MAQLFNGISSKKRSSFKQSVLAVALATGLALTGTQAVHASPNKAPPSIKAGAPQVYVVKKGDTLWGIAGKFLKSPWRWKEIWAGNRHVKNPHRIYPGDRLLMCSYKGKPLIGKDQGDGCAGIIKRHTGSARGPNNPQVRVEPLEASIATIPLAHIEHWLTRSIIMSPDSLTHVPYILAPADKRVLAGKGQIVYARGNGLEVGQEYGVYRQTTPYTEVIPAEKKYKKPVVKVLAEELEQVAAGVVTSIDASGTATIELTESYTAEVRSTDVVLPIYETHYPSMFFPTLKNQVTAGGKVIRVQGSISSGAKNSVVTINRGTKHGMDSGQVFAINEAGEVVQDPKTKQSVRLPDRGIGHVMIFKTFDNMSYGLILDATGPVYPGSSIVPSELID